MPTPKDLPGFYFDQEKNRYFPIKGPIPGLKRPPISTESSENKKRVHVKDCGRRKRMKPLELLRSRELLGMSIVSKMRRYDFKQEYEKAQVLNPQVWKFRGTTYAADSALEQMHGVIQTPNGLKEAHLLSTGAMNGSISLYEVGNVARCLNSGFTCTAESVWPEGTTYKIRSNTSFGSIWSSSSASTSFSSSISCIRRIGRHCPVLNDDPSSFQRALVTTFGSEVSGGSVHILNLSEPLDFSRSAPGLHRRTLKVDSFDCTIWTADCSPNGTHAVIGTDLGAALINLEIRASSWVYCPKSDILSQQFDHSGNIILCGLRNGGICVVDLREKQSRSSEVSSRHATLPTVRRVNHAYPMRHDNRSKQRFETKKNSTSSSNPSMSSSVCSLVSLQSDDQYFLGSSMDGSIKLFDRRLLHRGAIQTYEGHVNSHSYLQLSINPSETLVLSGGEDQCVRIWSIKTNELIFEENVSNSIHATVCWSHRRPSGIQESLGLMHCSEGNPFEINHSWGAWLGSPEALFYMHGT